MSQRVVVESTESAAATTTTTTTETADIASSSSKTPAITTINYGGTISRSLRFRKNIRIPKRDLDEDLAPDDCGDYDHLAEMHNFEDCSEDEGIIPEDEEDKPSSTALSEHAKDDVKMRIEKLKQDVKQTLQR